MPGFDLNDYQIRQLWRSMSARQQRAITKLAERALRLDRAATHAYELGRLDDAELLDEEATRTLQTLEEALAEVESESGDLNVDDESDVMREFAHLYERFMHGSDPHALDGLDADDYVNIARSIVSDNGGNADRTSDAQLLAAGRDAYERLHALGRQQRDVQSPRLTPRSSRYALGPYTGTLVVRSADREPTRRAQSRARRRR